ncbi:MAG: rod-binding protein [Deltaproteobacteria bacterium]
MKALSPVPSHLLALAAGSDRLSTEGAGTDKGLRRACEDFEAIFIRQMFQIMRRTIQKSGLFGGGMQEEILTDLCDEQVANEIAHGRGIGISQALYRDLAKAASRRDPQRRGIRQGLCRVS